MDIAVFVISTRMSVTLTSWEVLRVAMRLYPSILSSYVLAFVRTEQIIVSAIPLKGLKSVAKVTVSVIST